MYGWWGGKGEQRAKRPLLGKVRMRRIKGAEEFLQKLTGQKTKQGTPGKKLAPLIPQRPPRISFNEQFALSPWSFTVRG